MVKKPDEWATVEEALQNREVLSLAKIASR
jgi:hypothetical protein